MGSYLQRLECVHVVGRRARLRLIGEEHLAAAREASDVLPGSL
jgi:hypothetical protein